MIRIGFTGAYCTANFGDYAILLNNIADINADEYVVFTYSSSFPHKAIKHYFPNKKIELREVKIKEYIPETDIITPIDCLEAVSNIDEIRKIISQLDVICVSGGGYLDDNWCKRTDKYIKLVAPIIIAKQLGVKVVFMSHGIGPIIKLKETFRFLFNYVNDAHIAVRDDYCSKSYLTDIGVDKERIHILPDDLLFVNKQLLLGSHGLGNQRYISVVLHDTLDYIEENADKFVHFAKTIKEKYDLNVVFLPFDLVWYVYDQSKCLTKLISTASMIDIDKDENRFPAIEYVYDCISNSEMVITGRYHATIIAQQTNTPFLMRLQNQEGNCIYSYNKTYGALRQLFEGLQFDETKFMSTSWDTIFKMIVDDFETIVSYQKSLFENDKTVMNRERLYKKRIDYINRYIY